MHLFILLSPPQRSETKIENVILQETRCLDRQVTLNLLESKSCYFLVVSHRSDSLKLYYMSNNVDHDRLFKQLISTFFIEFIELFFPEVFNYLDRDSITFFYKEFFIYLKEG